MKVPWIQKNKIEQIALDVIKGYGEMTNQEVSPPIPVRDIIETFLDISLGTLNFKKQEGMEDVLGATYVPARTICINEDLTKKGQKGRFYFTCAHEVGHWVLHRKYLVRAQRTERAEGAIFCRSKDAREPIEWQADYFAACLLMPEKELQKAFYRICGNGMLVINNVRRSIKASTMYIEPCLDNWPLIAQAVINSGGFDNVSKQAMIIRLQNLGLLINLTKEKAKYNIPN